jgi:hypothetical protein
MHGKAVREILITNKAGRSAGGILLAAMLFEILAMAHHPSVGTPDIAQAAL